MGSSSKASVLAAALVVLCSTAAVADNSYWYVGGSIGTAWASDLDDLTDDDVSQAVAKTGLPPSVAPGIVSTDKSSASFDDWDDLDWKLYGGYQFNKYIGLEAMYVDLGEFERSARLQGAVALLVPARMVEETEVQGYGLSLVASYPFSEGLAVFAKAGVLSWETDTSGDLGIQTGSICVVFFCAPIADEPRYSLDDSGTDPMYGLGLTFYGQSWGVRFEWERFTGMAHGFDSETDMDLATVGFEYRFGAEN
jgi:OmpA-OmpF porin, OOP family